MEEKHKRVLQKLAPFLTKNLDIQRLQPHLIGFELVDIGHEFPGSTESQVKSLLALLERNPKGPVTYLLFRKALEDAEYKFITEKMDALYQDIMFTSEAAKQIAGIDEAPNKVPYFIKTSKYEEAIARLHHNMDKAIVLCGMNGSGKTQMSLALAEEVPTQCSNDEHNDKQHVKYQFKCNTTDNFLNSLRDLHSRMGLSLQKTKDDPKSQVASLLKDITSYLQNFCSCSVLIFDGLTPDTEKLIGRVTLTNDKYFAICTTNNQIWQTTLSLKVEGFTLEESLKFIELRSEEIKGSFENIFHTMPNADKENLAKEVSCSPLGLVSAINSMIFGSVFSVKEYIRSLDTMKVLIGKNQMFVISDDSDSDHEKSLLSAIMINLKHIKFNNENGDILKLLNCTAFMNHQDIPVDHFQKILNGNGGNRRKSVDKKNVVTELVKTIRQFSLGEVRTTTLMLIDQSNQIKERVLDIHLAVQRAIKLSLAQEEKIEAIESATVLLSSLCNKDTRFNEGFGIQMRFLPHYESVLNSEEQKMIEDRVAIISRIWLLISVGHLYSQRSMVLDTSEKYLNEAIKLLSVTFLTHEPEPIRNISEMIEREADLRQKACEVVDKLENVLSEKEQSSLFKKVILMQNGQTDVSQQVTRANSMQEYEYFTEETYMEQVSKNQALPKDSITKIFLPELLASLLYTSARLYFYSKRGHKSSYKQRQRKCMHFAVHIGRAVQKKYGICIMPLLLAQRQGTLYFSLETTSRSQDHSFSSVMNAKKEYTELKNDNDPNNYYEFGFLRKDCSDTYHENMCNRQLLRCHTFLLDKCDEIERESFKKYAKQFESSLKFPDVDNIHTKSAIFNQRARLLMKIDQNEKAKEFFLQSCEVEENTGHFKYTWVETLQGLVALHKTGAISYEDARHRIIQCQKFVKDDYSVRTQDKEQIDELLKELEKNTDDAEKTNVKFVLSESTAVYRNDS